MHQAAVQTVHGLMGLGVAGTFEGQDVAFLLQSDGGIHLLGQGALGALHRYGVILVHLYLHARGNRDRKSSDSRHCLTPPLRVGYQM